MSTYEASLAVYAARSDRSRGRRYSEPAAPGRSDYQRDRDRIIHCAAFRRLEYKTQVFVNTENDHYRTRLTHTLEVAQIARSVARQLRLNEDLTEAISLAHDLGHTPFGHAGQDALHECMKPYGGFEHNLQSLRVVDELEERYAAFNGLNLCFETREGILKHCSLQNAKLLGDLGQRFIDKKRPLLEAQIANLADEIAYNNHDIDDGLRSGLITLQQACTVPLFQRHFEAVATEFPALTQRRQVHETVRRMINHLIYDLIEQSRALLKEHNVQSAEQVRLAPALIAFSPQMHEQTKVLKQFLMKNLYRHSHVVRATNKARQIVQGLFEAFHDMPQLMPADRVNTNPEEMPRVIADYIAGMTDRYAVKTHKHIFNLHEL